MADNIPAAMNERDLTSLADELRWTADRVIINYAGERVWLKQIENGITDCCFASEPCAYHAILTHPARGTKQ